MIIPLNTDPKLIDYLENNISNRKDRSVKKIKFNGKPCYYISDLLIKDKHIELFKKLDFEVEVNIAEVEVNESYPGREEIPVYDENDQIIGTKYFVRTSDLSVKEFLSIYEKGIKRA